MTWLGRLGGWAGAGWEHATELEWLQGDAEALPLGNESIDSYSVAFGVRNMTHVRTALAEAHRWEGWKKWDGYEQVCELRKGVGMGDQGAETRGAVLVSGIESCGGTCV